jgi:hypothetical protein
MLELWYQALHAKYGIVVRTSNRERLKNKLYALRADAKDEDLSKVSIVMSPTSQDEIWLVKNGKQNGKA